MLTELRQIVCQMWEVVDKLDNNMGISKFIPFINRNSDLRHAITAEVMFFFVDVNGRDKPLSDEQITFLQYVLKVPITKDNSDKFRSSVGKINKLKYSRLIPFFTIVDITYNSCIARLYQVFLEALLVTFMSLSSSREIEMIIKYYLIMNNNKTIIERGTKKVLDYNPLDSILSNKNEMLEKICELNARLEDDRDFINILNAMDHINEINNDCSDNRVENDDLKSNEACIDDIMHCDISDNNIKSFKFVIDKGEFYKL